MVRSSGVVGALLPSVGCSQGTVGGNPFDVSDSMVPMEDDDDSATDPSESSATEASSSGVISESFSSGGIDPTTGEVDDSTSGDASTEAVSASDPSSSSTDPIAESSSSSSSGGDPPDGSQPATGMYAHCYDMFFDNCGAAAPICVNITGEMDGYCTADGCANPALDCDPAPGGTAQPFCFAAGGYSMCGLDCSSGESCATGMVCTIISFDGVTDYSVCM